MLEPGDDPRQIFLVGVLAPKGAPPEVAAEVDDLAALAPGVVDEGEPDAAPESAMSAPTGPAFLNPKALPNSFGISFRVPSGPVLADVAVTWGDYAKSGDRWERTPRHWIGRTVDLSKREAIEFSDLRLHILPDARSGRIGLYLENVRSGPGTDSASHVFQPQIRVVLAEKNLLPVSPGSSIGADRANAQLLYRDAQALARGHLCGAVWAYADPERFLNGAEAWEFWPDGQADPSLAEFVAPDVRSEFMPAVDVATPSFEWLAPSSPTRAAAQLASLDADELRTALSPLAEDYAAWVEGQRRLASAAGLDAALQDAADGNLARAARLAERIAEGIDLLGSDDDVRLSFAFAMQAIERQSAWQGRANFVWRPFQLAFILVALASVADDDHPDRAVCDLLWFATGGGKTEAYLALVAFAVALARLRAPQTGDLRSGHGTVVLTRYTLRLLTLQQFRRTARLMTACESLRVHAMGAGGRGWRPLWSTRRDDWLWGTSRMSVGLWVGGSVTPNRLEDLQLRGKTLVGGLTLLKDGRADPNQGEPAQVVRCPACDAWLAVPEKGLPKGSPLSLVYTSGNGTRARPMPHAAVETDGAEVLADTELPNAEWRAVTVRFSALKRDRDVVAWWRRVEAAAGVRIGPASAARPGYFLRTVQMPSRERPVDFDVYCPAPGCPLSGLAFREQVPVALDSSKAPHGAEFEWQSIPAPFRDRRDYRTGTRIPIPILTVDDQVYARLPSVLVATVDKFARLAFEPRAGSLFGNVDHYNGRRGFYRDGSGRVENARLCREVDPVPPPQLVLQDELHLIEGPLGSLSGLYEAAISRLMGDRQKYIASTATIAAAPEQISSLFARETSVFPQPTLSIGQTFWSEPVPQNPFDDERPGRLYLGVCAPGRGAQTPVVRVISSMLQEAQNAADEGASEAEYDAFATIVGYFNAVRELAGAVALSRQDVKQWMARYPSPRSYDDAMNLSSQAESTQLPVLLEELGTRGREAVPLVVATSMFGTGVDVPRLGAMFVNGQPKTTATYIQATGRVGRETGGLVLTLLRASRPRDLDHFEFFTGYHVALGRGVEPVSVAPFAPRARERLLGPISVALLRQLREAAGVLTRPWMDTPTLIHARRYSPEVAWVVAALEARAGSQPAGRRPQAGDVEREVQAAFDRWKSIADRAAALGIDIDYVEWAISSNPVKAVVLGDQAHEVHRLPYAFRRVSQSMREVESQTRFGITS